MNAYLRACHGKTRFTSRRAARRRARQIRRPRRTPLQHLPLQILPRRPRRPPARPRHLPPTRPPRPHTRPGVPDMNRSKAKGTSAETAVVRFLQTIGFIHAERRTLNGIHDRGDITGIPGVVIEVKNCARQELAAWVAEAERERDNDGASLGVVWHKRRGKSDPGDWFVTMSGYQFGHLLREHMEMPPLEDAEERDGRTQQCGHDDYHSAHEWADQPDRWCPGHSLDAA